FPFRSIRPTASLQLARRCSHPRHSPNSQSRPNTSQTRQKLHEMIDEFYGLTGVDEGNVPEWVNSWKRARAGGLNFPRLVNIGGLGSNSESTVCRNLCDVDPTRSNSTHLNCDLFITRLQ